MEDLHHSRSIPERPDRLSLASAERFCTAAALDLLDMKVMFCILQNKQDLSMNPEIPVPQDFARTIQAIHYSMKRSPLLYYIRYLYSDICGESCAHPETDIFTFPHCSCPSCSICCRIMYRSHKSRCSHYSGVCKQPPIF